MELNTSVLKENKFRECKIPQIVAEVHLLVGTQTNSYSQSYKYKLTYSTTVREWPIEIREWESGAKLGHICGNKHQLLLSLKPFAKKELNFGQISNWISCNTNCLIIFSSTSQSCPKLCWSFSQKIHLKTALVCSSDVKEV